jgi:capsular polysaccharide transport system ATP-binding protein
MGVPFDTYLIDEITSVGDLNFRLRCAEILGQRLEQASAIVVSHSMGMVRQICNAGVVLESGHAVYYEDLEEAIAVHEANMEAA